MSDKPFDPSKPLKNQRHELFAQNLAKGMSAVDAHENAGYKRSYANASHLLKDHKVLQRVLHLKSEGAELAAVTIGYVIDALKENMEISLGRRTYIRKTAHNDAIDEKGNVVMMGVESEVTERDPAAANKSLELLGQCVGLFQRGARQPAKGKDDSEHTNPASVDEQGPVSATDNWIEELSASFETGGDTPLLPN